jgi:hypothetical protein
MELKKLLAATTALTLLAAPAFASDNDALSTVVGNGNTVDIHQSTAADPLGGNDADVLIDFGNDNDVAINQESKFNGGGEASVMIQGGGGDDGSANTVDVFQQATGVADIDITGDRNEIDLDQYNNDSATIEITGSIGAGEGDDNYLKIKQGKSSLANGNTLEVTIDGDDNNRGSFTAGGKAAMAAGDPAYVGYHDFGGLTPGELGQLGEGNLMTVTLVDESSENQFALGQDGDFNTMTLYVDGNNNEAAAFQDGDSNVTKISQTGPFNVAGSATIGNGNVVSITQ